MPIVTSDGNWSRPLGTDSPLELHVASARDNLCLRCGVRVWDSAMRLHDDWHAKLNPTTED